MRWRARAISNGGRNTGSNTYNKINRMFTIEIINGWSESKSRAYVERERNKRLYCHRFRHTWANSYFTVGISSVS